MNQKSLKQLIQRAIKENITFLELPKKALTQIPKEIGYLTGLRFLYLKRNNISALPVEVGQLTHLRELDLTDNRLTTLPPTIGNLSNLERLELNQNKLTSLPQEVLLLDNLERLYLNNNELSCLPKEIGRLTNLRWLHLRGNHLTFIPKSIGKLTYLQVLDIRGNQLTALPAQIGNLKNLFWFAPSGNKLTSLPAGIGNLTLLEELDLSNNELTDIPPEVGKLTRLRKLNLSDNRLDRLPAELGQLIGLNELSLKQNKLTSLPPEIGKLNLRWLDVSSNNLISPPPEIIEQGTKAILAYLAEELIDSKRQWVSKLLVVGEGGVGKTSLLRALRNELFDTEESTTHGIEINTLYLDHPHESGVTMQLNTWDFGGQEIYHATHQFFLTNRSLFIVAWNARLGFEQGKLYYWLDTIKARAPESPVIIVATFIDEREANIPLMDLHRKYPQIVDYCEISNKSGAGIERFRQAICTAAANLPLMGETWPASWLNAANEISNRPENYITPNHLWEIMFKHEISQDRGTVLAQWLHELGDILFFRDDDELNDIVILNPQWVTQSISKVLESEEVIQNLGLFTRDHMNTLWADIEPSMREHFLRLMEKFDLSYRTLENKDISLVVERLSLDPPHYKPLWDEIKQRGACNELSMKFELDTSMPAGIPTWFIARSHRFTTRTHWRYGAVFADNPDHKHLGLIQAFPHDRYISLSVRGPIPYNFFALLVDGLDVTLKRFPGLTINRKIPCTGHSNLLCSHEFELSHLQKAVERVPPVLEIECPMTFEKVSVANLLIGLPWNLTNEVIINQNNIIIAGMQDIKEGVYELRELTQREFTKAFHSAQAKIESYCPNIFVLRPAESENWSKNIFGQGMELHLYCQKPGQWHPTDSGGVYLIRQPSEWLRTIAPYIRRMVSVLKYSTPLIGPWIGFLSPDQYEKRLKNDIKLMEELVKKLPSTTEISNENFDDPRSSIVIQNSVTEISAGASLRALRQLLDKEDPMQTWGNLRKVLTPEGHYLWLCQHHAAEYLQ